MRAHFEINYNHTELKDDRNEYKHHNIAKRMVKRGGRRDIFLGTRECQAFEEPCTFGEGESFYDTEILQDIRTRKCVYFTRKKFTI